VLIPCLAATSIVFDLALGRTPDRTIHVVRSLATVGGGTLRLHAGATSGVLEFDGPTLVEAIELRPHMPLSATGAFEPTELTVLDDADAPLGPTSLIERSGQRVVVSFPERVLGRVRLVRGPDGAPLLLPPGSVRAQRAVAATGTTAALVAGLLGAIGAAVGFSAVILGRRHLSRTLAVVVGFLVPVAGVALGWLPQTAAVRAYARDEWPLDGAAVATATGSLSLVVAVMLLAVVTGRPRDAA
jgi:hypothetical protein